ncbi:MAG TPA: 16S rRNA processing protein RimM [Clostridiales bacterium]|nr:16S rRNA processing protein RimM [Clostridiales bacterium]
MTDKLAVGLVLKPWKVKGQVKVLPLTDNIERFNSLKYVYGMLDNKEIKLTVSEVKYQKQFVLISFNEIGSIDEAEKLRGSYLKIDRKDAVKLPEDRYFIADLIDCKVVDSNHGYLGVIKDIIQTGSNDVYVVKGYKREHLIPALKSVVNKIDIHKKEVLVTCPEGLMEI